jgi:hypothetical protein
VYDSWSPKVLTLRPRILVLNDTNSKGLPTYQETDH